MRFLWRLAPAYPRLAPAYPKCRFFLEVMSRDMPASSFISFISYVFWWRGSVSMLFMSIGEKLHIDSWPSHDYVSKQIEAHLAGS